MSNAPSVTAGLDAAPIQLAQDWVGRLDAAFTSGNPARFRALFTADGYWKDILAFTGGYRTFAGWEQLETAWLANVGRVGPSSAHVAAGRTPPRRVRRSGRAVVEVYVDFETLHGHGTAFVRIIDDESADRGQAWILLTTLQSLRGHEERLGPLRPTGIEYSHNFAGDNWLDKRIAEQRFIDRDPEVVIVGAGQGGLILAARLKQMGVDALVVERTPRVGDTWRNRYHSLTLHNEVWTNSMPYLPFPETWPTFLPKDKLAGWLEYYAEAMELNVWTSTELVSATRRADGGWSLELALGDGATRSVRAPHLVLAVGGSTGVPNMPALPGLDAFAGEIVHSSSFTSGVQFAGKHAIVVGTGTSGHDVAQDLYENGASSVTMIQRGPTCVVSLVPSGTMVYALYSEGPPPEDIDLITAAIPYPVLRDTYQWLTRRTCELDKDLLDRLRNVGFKLTFGPDETGFHMMYLREGGGYYINVGCSDLIADGAIKVIQAEELSAFTPEGLTLGNGRRLQADLVVLATGYRNLQEGVAGWLGPEVAGELGPIWGFDDNYVMRNMWQRTGQPGLWLMGGALVDARLHSRFLAVQIAADLRGVVLEATPSS
jgi:cation diffusion facilitator CzcD-associated flavoprotein CzcO